jgi:hypothetical protein
MTPPLHGGGPEFESPRAHNLGIVHSYYPSLGFELGFIFLHMIITWGWLIYPNGYDMIIMGLGADREVVHDCFF